MLQHHHQKITVTTIITIFKQLVIMVTYGYHLHQVVTIHHHPIRHRTPQRHPPGDGAVPERGLTTWEPQITEQMEAIHEDVAMGSTVLLGSAWRQRI